MIERIQFHGNFEEIEDFVGGDTEYRDGKLLVATPFGPLTAKPGEWIIREADGSFWVEPDA